MVVDETISLSKEENKQINKGLCSLFTAVSQFPTNIIIRSDFANHINITRIVANICNDALYLATLEYNCLKEQYTSRSFLMKLTQNLSSSFAFIEHCDFLQQLPTINFYTATQLLSLVISNQLSEDKSNEEGGMQQLMKTITYQTGSNPENHITLNTLNKENFHPEISPTFIDSFIKLVTAHIGLKLQQDPGSINVHYNTDRITNNIMDENNEIPSPDSVEYSHTTQVEVAMPIQTQATLR